MTFIRRNQNGISASVTFAECAAAHTAVKELAHETWDNYVIQVRPSFTRTSVDSKRQNYTLKVQWYLTESECTGRVAFNKAQAAQQAYQIFTRRHRFCCQFEISSVNPTIRCSWPLTPHQGHAIVHFTTVEQAQAVNFYRNAIYYEFSILFRLSKLAMNMHFVSNLVDDQMYQFMSEMFHEIWMKPI